eukprot:SAG31_NODE_42820_length_270_cov_0.456140_1_plen_67_part_01
MTSPYACRDVKPENLLRGASEVDVKLVDFGLANGLAHLHNNNLHIKERCLVLRSPPPPLSARTIPIY